MFWAQALSAVAIAILAKLDYMIIYRLSLALTLINFFVLTKFEETNPKLRR
jgi:hypothetical protein